ncbi:MAG TPA: hypothetical protein VL463_21785 [Kofleriaceae bacterium]|jgi:hypothetical protein|nr:hypothetical protein [Kofleriaceae bacterium]
MKRQAIALTTALAFAAACGGYSKETVSLYREHVGMRVPNQQRLIALSTDEAVARLDFKGLAGKKVIVEMSGVFPHTRADVLDYIQGQVEGKIARDGGLVISAGQLVVAPAETNVLANGAPAATDVATGSVLSLTPGDADYRVIIGVSWAGVDTHDRLAINDNLLLKQGALMGGGLLLAIIGAGQSDSSSAAGFGSVGGLAFTGGMLWYFLQKPTIHIYRLLGRVRLSVNAVPIVPGGTPFQTVGEGQTELLVDPTADEGYILQ